MKKIALTLALAITSLITFAQNPITLQTYKNSVGYYNNTTQQFDFENYVYANIAFSFYDTYISVSDVNHSVYRITENLPKKITRTYETSSAKCLDENNRSCVVGIMTYTDGSNSTIGVVYDDRMFLYIIDK
jgi:hypothetical protein